MISSQSRTLSARVPCSSSSASRTRARPGSYWLPLLLSRRADDSPRALLIGWAVLTVMLSWTVINTVYTLRYADQYFQSKPGGIAFGTEDGQQHPSYRNFAYVAFTIGMHLLRAVACDLNDYAALRDQKLATLPGVRRLTSTIVMKRIVDNRPLPLPARLATARRR